MTTSQHGYAGRILTVDLSSRKTGELSTLDYAGAFVGGRGIAARLYRDRVPPSARALEADNALVFATGPVAGIPSIGGSRWMACGKSKARLEELGLSDVALDLAQRRHASR